MRAPFFALALDCITWAADLFRPVYDRTNGVDGWVSLEVSPLLAYDTNGTIKAAKELSKQAARPNLFIKIPGTKKCLLVIEESIFEGIPINVTLLFSSEQYVAAARGLPTWHQTAHRRRAEPPGRFCGLHVHQSLGCCGGQPVSRAF